MKLTEERISKLILKIALPAGIGMMFHTFYNLVDTYWAGQFSAQGLAALSLSFVPFLLILSVGMGLSQGTNALISNALGKGDMDKARHYQQQSIILAILLSVLLSLLGYWLSPFIFSLMGGEGTVLELSLEYMNVIWLGTPFIILVQTMNAGLMAQGDTVTNRNALIAGFLINIILDPLFLYGWGVFPALGIGGIALATVVIQACVMIFIASKLYTSKLMQRNHIGEYTLSKDIASDILHQGAPASLSMMLVTAGLFIITGFVGRFGEDAIAAYGVGIRIEQMILLPSIGLNMAALSLVGQNHGAGLKDRVKETYLTSAKYGFILMSLGALLVYALAEVMMKLFTQKPAIISIGAEYLKIDALVLPAYALLFLTIAVLQGVKRPYFGLVMNFYRQIIGPLFIFFILVDWYGIGLLGIWWGVFAVTWSAALFSFGYLVYSQKWFPHQSSS